MSVAIPYTINAADLCQLCDQTGVQVLVASELSKNVCQAAIELAAASGACPLLRHLIVAGPSTPTTTAPLSGAEEEKNQDAVKTWSFDQVLQLTSPTPLTTPLAPVSSKPDDIRAILCTSGTTGSPTAVTFTERIWAEKMIFLLTFRHVSLVKQPATKQTNK